MNYGIRLDDGDEAGVTLPGTGGLLFFLGGIHESVNLYRVKSYSAKVYNKLNLTCIPLGVLFSSLSTLCQLFSLRALARLFTIFFFAARWYWRS